jgi:hypothetical protein
VLITLFITVVVVVVVVGSANFCGWRGVVWSARRFPTVVFRFSRPEPLLFL